jgi:Mg/Co/Ni transporter MgtE
MGMFGMVSKKSGGSDPVTGEYGGDMVSMMKMLGGMPHMMRKPMMKGRINQMLSLTEEQRQVSIRDMIGAFNSEKVKGKIRESLVATRVEILGELSEEQRRTIISSRTEALKVVPELDKADLQIQERILHKVPQNTRQAFLKTWEHVRKNAGQ